MLPTLEASAGKDNVSITPVMGAEDFHFIKKKFQGLYFFLRPKGKPISETAPSYSRFILMKVVLF
jgi:hypothetical protein